MGLTPHPSLYTGTSSEFLGRRPLPRLVASRPVVFVLGPEGAGKTRVAERVVGPGALWLGPMAFNEHMSQRVGARRWAPELLAADRLVLDGICFLRARPGAARFIAELVRERVAAGRRTVLVQGDHEASLDVLLREFDDGVRATVALRFPKGERGRLRFARRVCDRLGIPRTAARGTEQIEPWSYLAVIRALATVTRLQPRSPRAAEAPAAIAAAR